MIEIGIERAEEASLEKVTLGSIQTWPDADGEHKQEGNLFQKHFWFHFSVFSSSSSVSEDITLIVPQTKHGETEQQELLGKNAWFWFSIFSFGKLSANMGDCGFLCSVQRSSLYLLWCERLVSHCKLSYFSALSMIKHLYLVVLGKTLLVA